MKIIRINGNCMHYRLCSAWPTFSAAARASSFVSCELGEGKRKKKENKIFVQG